MEEVREVADHIKRMGCDALAIEADMSKEDDCIKLIERANNYFGRINVLVNNAGIQQDVPFENTTTEEWYKIIGVDLTGPFIYSREAVKHMEKQDPKGGCIINISSVHQRIPKPHYVLLLPFCYIESRRRNDDKNYGFGVGKGQYSSRRHSN
jgi:glucose 1-dehydrogenase